MTKNARLRKLLQANPLPRADSDKVLEGLALVERLRRMGIKQKQYELSSPFGDRGWILSGKAR